MKIMIASLLIIAGATGLPARAGAAPGENATAAAPAAGRNVQIKVKGMVCGFCAQGLDKKFRSEPAVEDVKVTLKDKMIRLTLKEDREMEDAAIEKIVKDAGYNVESIER